MIVSFEQLPEVRATHAKECMVFTTGSYDLVHEGHVEGLEYRRSLGDLLIVGLATDEQISRRKGPDRPIRKELARISLINALRPVDYTFLLPGVRRGLPSAALQTIAALHPDIFADLGQEGFWERDRAAIEEQGVEFIYDPLPKVESSSNIISRVLAAQG